MVPGGNDADGVGRIKWLGILAYLIPVLILLIYRSRLPAIFCDDAYITFRTAVNFSKGDGLVFNIGEKVYLLTTPLWALLLTAGRFFTDDVIETARILGTASEIFFLCSLVYLGYAITGSRKTGMLAAILMCANPVYLLTSFSGMELSLYLALIALSFALLAKGHHCWSLSVAALAVWVRFDGVLLFIIIAAWAIPPWLRVIRHYVKLSIRDIRLSYVIVILYIVFGLVQYGDVVPVSVRVKLQYGPPMFSSGWWLGAWVTLREFGGAFLGKSAYWYVAGTPYWVLVLPLVIGIRRLVDAKDRRWTPLIVFSLLYALLFILGGKGYATNFPWYFVPPLLGLYVLAAWGCIWVLSLVTCGLAPGPKYRLTGFTAIVVAFIWINIATTPLARDAGNLMAISNGRERMYGAIAVWLSDSLPEGATIAANEIGAVGFFSRRDIRILDMFGILRTREERNVYFIDLMRAHRPEAVITGEQFKYRELIDEEMPGEYLWLSVRKIEIGVRDGLIPTFTRDFKRLEDIYRNLDTGRECR